MNYSRAERETTIVYDEEERIAHIYTASQITIRRLDKLCADHPDIYRRTWTETEDQKITAARYECPSKYIRFGKPASEQKRAQGVRMYEHRMKNQQKNFLPR